MCVCKIKVNISMYIGYGVRTNREGEVESTAFDLAGSITNFQILVSVLKQWFSNFSEHQDYLENLLHGFLGSFPGDSLGVG